MSDIGTSTSGNLDMILSAKHRVVTALLYARNRWKNMPAGGIVIDIRVAYRSTA